MVFLDFLKCPRCESKNVYIVDSAIKFVTYRCKDCDNRYTIRKPD